ncbi:MAG: L,D-transpeptidase [Armatimonadota bacterium]
MRRLIVLLTLFLAQPLLAQSIALTGPNRQAMLEGTTYPISWSSDGIASVSVVASGERTPLGRRSRGAFVIVVAQGVPASAGSVAWTVPWVDSWQLLVKVKGYDSTGRLVANEARPYGFRPAVLADRTVDGLYLDLHERKNQRLYVQKNYQIVRAYLSSSSENYCWLPSGRHVPKPHDHAGVFWVLSKKRSHWSSQFHVWMPYAMRYHGGHFVHATSPNLYDKLGRPASHGCNRLTRDDARELYYSIPIGTRVEVIGPRR